MCLLRCCAVLFLFVMRSAWADLPLTIEDILTDKGKVKLDLSLAYANNERTGVSVGEPVLVQTGRASFVIFPGQVGERISNSDSLVGTFGLRYGVTSKTEIYTRTSFLTSNQRSISVSGTSNTRNSRFADMWAGINVKFKQDEDTPALLGFAEFSLAEKHRESMAYLKSALFGLTTYKAIDPVALSLTAAYRFNRSRKDGHFDYRPGNLFLLNSSIGFAVNDRITLTAGAQWTRRQADKLNDTSQGISRTATDLLLGMGYGINKGNSLNFSVKTNVSGASGAELRSSWLYTF